jgi:hypothetical protein
VVAAERTNDGGSKRDASILAQDVLSALSGTLFRPLTIELILACCEPQSGYPLDEPPSPFQLLVQSDTLDPVRVWQSFGDTVVRSEPDLDEATIRRWFAQVQQFGCSGVGSLPGWSNLLINATEVRVPSAVPIHEESVNVSYGQGSFHYPVHAFDDGHRLVAPLVSHPETNAFELAINNEGAHLNLELSMTWSWWADSDGPGRPELSTALQKLQDLEWRIEV